MHSWNIFSAWMNHEHTRTHKTHHCMDLGEATTFPLIIFFVIRHGGYIQMPFGPRTPKIPEIGTCTTLEAHNVFFKPLIEVSSKEKL